MIIRLEKAAGLDTPWLVFSADDEAWGFINPPPALQAMMRERTAWFEANLTPRGWMIVSRVAGERRQREAPRSGAHRRAGWWS